MYINLILGAVALIVVWLYLRKMLVKDDDLRETPKELLEKEVARRHAAEVEAGKAFERLRDTAKERMRPVAAALAEMRAAIPSVAGEETGSPQKVLTWDDNGDTILVRVRANGASEDAATLSVSWRTPEMDLRRAAGFGDLASGVYVLLRSDKGGEETVAGLDACVRSMTSFIVDFMT